MGGPAAAAAVEDGTAMAAAVHFATYGDTASNQLLKHAVDHSLDAGGTPAARTIAPQLLLRTVHDAAAPSLLSYVCVLNRHFCVQVLLDSLAQPLDRRPAALDELLHLYLAVLPATAAHPAARRQLVQCVACLLIVLEDSLVGRLHVWIGGSGESGAVADESRLALCVLIEVADLLADRRVQIGSIRRATQRRQLQEHLEIVLQSPLAAEADMPLLLRATDAAVRFLLEAMYGEPQEVAEAFWAALPASPVWQHCLRRLDAAVAASPPSPCPAAVLDLVCNVLRCQTLVNAAAEALLLGALPPVLQPVTAASAASVDWAAVSRVIAAALEASTEAMVTQQAGDVPLFRLFSAAADRLALLLQSPAAPATAVCHVCEGLSALTQALQPAPLPVMESDDDPDDFADFAEQTRLANAEKAAAVVQLRSFLGGCTGALAARLTQSGFTRPEWCAIAAHVARRVADNEVEDFEVAHDEVELAVFTSYERLTALLGPLTADEICAAAAEPGTRLVLVMAHADSLLWWLESSAPAALLVQSPLLPCTVARHARAPASSDGGAALSTTSRVAAALMSALTTLDAPRDAEGKLAVLDVAAAATAAVLALARRGDEQALARVREGSAPLVATLWQCATSTPAQGAAAAAAATRHRAVDELALLLAGGVAALPESALGLLAQQDAYTQALLCATAGAATPSLDTVDALAHTLACVAHLSAEEAQTLEGRVCEAVAQRARRHCEAATWSGDALASLLDGWHAEHPHLVQYFLRIATAAVAPGQQPALLLAGLSRFFAQPHGEDTATRELVLALDEAFVQPVAAAASTAAALHDLLRWLLQPHPAFTASDGARRVHVLAQCGRALSDAGHVPGRELADSLVLCVARWRECVAASALPTEAADGEPAEGEDDGDGEAPLRWAVLQQLAMWGRCVAGVTWLAAVNAPAWLTRLQAAGDDYERADVLKAL